MNAAFTFPAPERTATIDLPSITPELKTTSWMRVTVAPLRRVSTGAISVGIPIIAMGWDVRSCAICREGAAQRSNARARNAVEMAVEGFVLVKVRELSHTPLGETNPIGGLSSKKSYSHLQRTHHPPIDLWIVTHLKGVLAHTHEVP